MKILIIGQGGREHALAWKMAQSKQVTQIWVAPGNAGTQLESRTKNLPIAATEINKLLAFAKEEAIDLTVVGPENALARGIVDHFKAANLLIFGPNKRAAQLETSKAFSKTFMTRHQIPTAPFQIFSNQLDAHQYIINQTFPIVIKVDGLAAGKGVYIIHSAQESEQALTEIFREKRFGHSGQTIIVENFLIGEELSFMALVHHGHCLPLATARDYKKRYEGDAGPNTGGMGAYSPVSQVNDKLTKKIISSIMEPTIQGLQKEGIPFTGFLYAGLMISPDHSIHVLEFNVRLGDPETQALMMRLDADLVDVIFSLLNDNPHQTIPWTPQTALTVVLTQKGYPSTYCDGDPILGLDHSFDPNVKIFHAGTQFDKGQIIAQGGRVLNVSALGINIAAARTLAYEAIKQISWPNYDFRKDIGSTINQKEQLIEPINVA